MIYLYCDGACSGNQHDQNLGGWGAILTFNGHEKELFGSALNTTNNRMELTALLSGLTAIKNRNHSVTVFSDSAYIVNCFQQKWYVGWRKRNWLNSKKQPVENRDLWQAILDLVALHPAVAFYKVKGHLKGDDEQAIKSWHAKLIADYQVNITLDDYRRAVAYNIRADALANRAIDQLRGANNATNTTD